MRTIWHHWKAIKRLCRERPIALMFIPVPPYVPMMLGRLAYETFGIPYVIDYIDPWVTDYYNRLPRNQRPPKWFLADILSRIVEPYAVRHVAQITGVSKGTTDAVIQRYSWLSQTDATEIPYGAESKDFEYVRRNPRQNQIFDPLDGMVHLSCVGACIPGMYPAVRALFRAVRAGLESSPERFSRLQLHFVGTSYTANGPGGSEAVMEIAREEGIQDHVDERRQRVSYLDSLQLMLDSRALLLIGSDEPHYTASKVFPYMLAERPLLAIFHEDSSVVEILEQTKCGRVITFNKDHGPDQRMNLMVEELERILSLPLESRRESRLHELEAYSTRAMTGRLVEAFDRALPTRDAVTAETPKSEVRSPKFDF